MEPSEVNIKELEYKYKADDVKIADFRKLMDELGWQSQLDVSSWDVYFVDDQDDDKFIRFRNGAKPELTRKEKVKSTNNWDRVEIDLPLDKKRLSEAIVEEFVTRGGYKENFRIYKTCFIYFFENVNYVYYIVYDTNMKEQGRFIEVEVNKDKVGETDLDWHAAQLETLGLTYRNRMKRSLFEMFRRTG